MTHVGIQAVGDYAVGWCNKKWVTCNKVQLPFWVTDAMGDTCREFEFSLLSGPALEKMAVAQRLQVNAAIAIVRLAYGGKLVVETTDLTAQAIKVFSGSSCAWSFN